MHGKSRQRGRLGIYTLHNRIWAGPAGEYGLYFRSHRDTEFQTNFDLLLVLIIAIRAIKGFMSSLAWPHRDNELTN